MDPDPGELRLWEAYRQGGDPDSKQRLFFRYVPWARTVARDVYRRVYIPQMDWSDYAQNATVGLLEAMHRFDPGRGVDFMGYARPRVRGAVFNGLRSFLAQFRGQSIGDRWHDRVESFDPSGTEDPLDLMVSAVAGLGIGFLLDSGTVPGLLDAPDASTVAEQGETDLLLAESIEALPEKEKLVVNLHYYQHLPFVEIAGLLGLTKGRISQIHKAAIERIRATMRGSDGLRHTA